MNSDRIEEWNQRYRAREQVFDPPFPLVAEFTRNLAAGSALDLACGPGRNALYLAERGWRITAVDGSPVAIDLLLARAGSLAIDLAIDARVLDLEAGEFVEPAEMHDLVLSCYYLQRSLIPLMKSALRCGGLLIMIVHLAEASQPHGTPTRAFPGELRTFFEGWRILHYREGEPGESGHRHAVAELVAQKPT
ncbi:MAG: methyltransferase domain-containing protein [Bryobacteraceae bacterium]